MAGRTGGTAGRTVSARREQILSAAAPLFAQRGFHGVSVDDLGAASGISGPALYRHFRAKEEILAELLIGVSRTLLVGGRQRRAAAPDAASALEELIAWHVEFALDNPDVITVQARELSNLPPRSRRTVRELQNVYVRMWAEVVSAVFGGDREATVAAAHAAFGLMNSTPHSAKLPREKMARLLRAMALSSLRASAGPEALRASDWGDGRA